MNTEKRELRTYIDPDGRLSATLAKSELPEDELCDFCSGQDRPFKIYRCNDFDVEARLISRGAWNACPNCSAFIDRDDREGLLHRSINQLHNVNIPLEFAEQSIGRIHKLFFQNLKKAALIAVTAFCLAGTTFGQQQQVTVTPANLQLQQIQQYQYEQQLQIMRQALQLQQEMIEMQRQTQRPKDAIDRYIESTGL
jgi:hypothetical protein